LLPGFLSLFLFCGEDVDSDTVNASGVVELVAAASGKIGLVLVVDVAEGLI
jgi:hypothetical protein